MSLRAGAGRACIAIPAAALPFENFHAVHDPLSARVLVLDDGKARVALAVIDQTSVFEHQLNRLLGLLHEMTGTPLAHCLVVASHTFSAPHVFPPGRLAGVEEKRNALISGAVDDAVRRAAADAAGSLRPARLGAGDGVCRVNVNRDVPTPEGWWLGADDGGPTDHTVAVLRIDDVEGRPLALVLNYAVQSSVMQLPAKPGHLREISADLAGAACRAIEEAYDAEAVALFLPGAAGDQAPYLTTTDPVAARVLLEALGARLAQVALRAAYAVTPADLAGPLSVTSERMTVRAQTPPPGLHALHPTRGYVYRPDGDTDALVTLLRIGDLTIAGLQAELGARTGMAVKAASSAKATWIATMVNGGAKYMADQESYDRCTYEAMNSRYARGTAELVGGPPRGPARQRVQLSRTHGPRAPAEPGRSQNPHFQRNQAAQRRARGAVPPLVLIWENQWSCVLNPRAGASSAPPPASRPAPCSATPRRPDRPRRPPAPATPAPTWCAPSRATSAAPRRPCPG